MDQVVKVKAPYVNSAILAGGTITRILESGVGDRKDPRYLVEYVVGSMSFEVLIYDKKGKMKDFKPFSATIYGTTTRYEGKQVIKANSVIDNDEDQF